MFEHILILAARIRLACTLKLNGRDGSNITLNQDEETTFIAKAAQNSDAIIITGLYLCFAFITEKILKTTTISVTIIATPSIIYII